MMVAFCNIAMPPAVGNVQVAARSPGWPRVGLLPRTQILSWYPRIVVFPGFIDKSRAEYIVKLASKFMYPSGLAYRPGEAVDPTQQTRTSTGTFLASAMDPEGVLGCVEQRIAAATLLPADNGEAFNVLHYEKEQHYDSHYDTFDPKEFGPQPSQRIATVLL
ncbi:hypothetical protein Vretimale_17146 [Volvox reticuliferus]|uniref:Prolyl 4-hydroxylase alpha subunit Fe(2+) 2OG dioxygenase domain-containing protein n=1 Tax=Volvox reticuliferus TaxID=1737510 RepID=A0A8J4GVJ5_9CHLO|nr:hypothetical protein Vretifemale_18593 [Volvox reticuliferus]GIM14132.1 hypothetical protein Vretimale_17146 [Volvox reticuliferus]